MTISLDWLGSRFGNIAFEPNTGCWLWMGGLHPKGYGPHRKIFLRSGRSIPKGFELDHLCRVRSCVNPEHLEPVTHAVNLARGLRGALKHFCPLGHPLVPGNVIFKKPKRSNYRPPRICRTCNIAANRLWRAKKKLGFALNSTPSSLPNPQRDAAA
jgi:hypothetical protein